MDKDAILQFIKKNAFPLSCGVVALAAVILLFYPLGGWVQDLQDRSAAAAGQFNTVAAFTKPRNLPTVDPTKTAKTELATFPNPTQVKVGEAAIEKLTAGSQETLGYLLKLNDLTVHPMLVPGLLPKPASDTLKFQFADLYKKALSTDPAMSGVGAAGGVPPPVQADPAAPDPMRVDDGLALVHARNLFNDVLRAGTPADNRLIEARKEWLWQNKFLPQVVTVNGVAVNKPTIDQQFTVAAHSVPDELAQEIARTRKVYVDHDAFNSNPAFLPGSATNPNLSDIWFAQMQLWVQTDLAQAVADINAASAGVEASPVKRIIKLELPSSATLYRNGPASGAGGGGGTVGPSTANETQALPLVYAAAPTGHVSNGMYDVVPFALLIDVDASRVNDVLAGLTRNRLIYVDNQSACSLDPASLTPQGYLYGPGPVVRLTIYGEDLFLRAWTKDLMPLQVQQQLGLAPGGTVVGPSNQTGAMPAARGSQNGE